jgi:hypothetical protein
VVLYASGPVTKQVKIDELVIANAFSIVSSKIPVFALLNHLDQVGFDPGLFTDLTHRRSLGGFIFFDDPLGKLPSALLSDRNQRDVDLSSTRS